MSKLTDYKNNYIAANYDRINLTVPKGVKALIEERAKSEGKSTNGFIGELIRQALDGTLPAHASVKVETKKAAPAEKKSSAPAPKAAPKAASKKDMDTFLL